MKLSVIIQTLSGRTHRYESDTADIRIPSQTNIHLTVKNDQIIVSDDHADSPIQTVITLY